MKTVLGHEFAIESSHLSKITKPSVGLLLRIKKTSHYWSNNIVGCPKI